MRRTIYRTLSRALLTLSEITERLGYGWLSLSLSARSERYRCRFYSIRGARH